MELFPRDSDNSQGVAQDEAVFERLLQDIQDGAFDHIKTPFFPSGCELEREIKHFARKCTDLVDKVRDSVVLSSTPITMQETIQDTPWKEDDPGMDEAITRVLGRNRKRIERNYLVKLSRTESTTLIV